MIGYELLIAGIALFMILHLIAGFYAIRTKLVDLFGTVIYRVIHSLGAISSLVLMVMGYGEKPDEIIYMVSEWGQQAPIILMPISLIFLVGFGFKGVIRITRHPLLWAIIFWSGSHLLANGDKASLMLFGSFFLYGIIAMFLNDNKKSKTDPKAWAELKAHTSILPFAAMLSGRAAPAFGDHGLKAVIGGLFLYSLLIWLHGYISGVTLLMV